MSGSGQDQKTVQLKNLRFAFTRLIYSQLTKHLEPDDAKLMATKKEAKIFESCSNLAQYRDKYEQELMAARSTAAPPLMPTSTGAYVPTPASSRQTSASAVASEDLRYKYNKLIEQYVRQLTEGLRIAREFPMEFHQLRQLQEKITDFMRAITTPAAKNKPIEALRADVEKLKQIILHCMDAKTVEKMKVHHQALKLKQKRQQEQLMMRGQVATGGGAGTEEYLKYRAELKEKVKKLFPIRMFIIETLKSHPKLPAKIQQGFQTVRRKIENIVNYYREECKTIDNVRTCTQYLVKTYHLFKEYNHQAKSYIPSVSGAASAPTSTAAAANTIDIIKTDTKDYVKRLTTLYEFYKKMIDFRQETKPDIQKDETNFNDEVTEIRSLRQIVHSIVTGAKLNSSRSLRLPDEIKTRIKHLEYSAALRKQLVLYLQLRPLKGCADKCNAAKGKEWYFPLQPGVTQLIKDINHLTSPPSPDVSRVFESFLRFRNNMRTLKAQSESAMQAAPPPRKLTAAQQKAAAKRANSKVQNRKRGHSATTSEMQMAALGIESGLGPPTGGKSAADKKAAAAAKRKADAARKRAETARRKKAAAAEAAASPRSMSAVQKRKMDAAAAAASQSMKQHSPPSLSLSASLGPSSGAAPDPKRSRMPAMSATLATPGTPKADDAFAQAMAKLQSRKKAAESASSSATATTASVVPIAATGVAATVVNPTN